MLATSMQVLGAKKRRMSCLKMGDKSGQVCKNVLSILGKRFLLFLEGGGESTRRDVRLKTRLFSALTPLQMQPPPTPMPTDMPNPFFVNAEHHKNLGALVNMIQSEEKRQVEANAGQGGEPDCTFTEMFWLTEDAERCQSGRGGRFVLAKKGGFDLPDYTLKLGTYVKTNKHYFFRKRDEHRGI